jgi:hypothetical protein
VEKLERERATEREVALEAEVRRLRSVAEERLWLLEQARRQAAVLESERADLLDRLAVIRTTASLPSAT